jgi:hypothetical protein
MLSVEFLNFQWKVLLVFFARLLFSKSAALPYLTGGKCFDGKSSDIKLLLYVSLSSVVWNNVLTCSSDNSSPAAALRT